MDGSEDTPFAVLRERTGLSLQDAASLLGLSMEQARTLERGMARAEARHLQVLRGLEAARPKKLQRVAVSPEASHFTYYDFFAGGGMAGIGLGSRWKCTFANDFDPGKAAAYRAFHGDDSLVVKDIRQVTAAELPGTADLAWASFPCQDLSLAGAGAGLRSDRSGMFWRFWQLIRALDREERAPRVIVLENVYGLLTSNNGHDFATIASAFSGRGYRFGAVVIDAKHFVPQSRERVFIIGLRKDLKPSENQIAFGADPRWHPKALVDAHALITRTAASRWIWWHLPDPPRRNVGLADLIEDQPTGVKWHTRAETAYILSLMSPVNLAKVEAAKQLKRRVVGTIYRRTRPNGNGGKAQRAEVRFDEVAGCLRTPRGGSSRQTILVAEGDCVRSRLLSPREAARLMGLPDEYPLPKRYNDAYHLAGDGVVVPVVRHLSEYIIEPLLASASAGVSSKQRARSLVRRRNQRRRHDDYSLRAERGVTPED
jgi:DNA (cytosine-5)-methyltransferase 1